MIDRVTEIREARAGLGAEKGRSYPTKELCERYEQLQAALARGVFEKTHAENMRDKDVRNHFRALSETYGLLDNPCFTRLDSSLQTLGYAIGSFKRGANGERECQKALRTFTYDPDVKFLCNIALESEVGKTEYDAIVIAPYGLFIIEMKNWAGPIVITEHGILKQKTSNGTVYSLVERMNVKKDLLRGLLGDKMPDIVQPMLVFSDARTEVDDQYHKIEYCIAGEFVDKIREHKKFGTCLSNEAIEYIYTTLKANHKEQMSYCSIDCTQIIEDYATLMAQIEELAREDKEKNNNEELTCTITLTPVSEIPKNNTPFFSRVFNTKSLSTLGKILGAVCVAAPAVSALVAPRCR